MSYDLMVFDPDGVPVDREAFLEWYRTATTWAEPHDYSDPRFSSPRLQRWAADMRRRFWALNGPFRSRLGGWLKPDDFGDYNCASHSIYMTFAWSRAEQAHELALSLARLHRLGFYDLSGSGEVILPDGAGKRET